MPSPAKINLSLWVKGKRNDGYHEIITVMHTINLYDILSFLPSDRLELHMEGNQTLPLGSSNLIIKACKLFKEKTGINPKVKIKLEKRIPVGAGLGGGSSNAASTLKALNIIYGNPLSEDELIEISQDLGSDVPFFIKGGLALSYGKGEKLKFYNPASFKLLLIYPNIFCSTKEVYEKLPPLQNQITIEDVEKLIISPLINQNFKELLKNARNDLELSQAECIEEVKKVKEKLKEAKIENPIMSGSGSSLFTIEPKSFDENLLKKEGWWYKLLNAV